MKPKKKYGTWITLTFLKSYKNMKQRTKFTDYDVVITEYDEHFYYWEAVKYNQKVVKKATKKEADEYRKEFDYHQQVEQENQSVGSYHELEP